MPRMFRKMMFVLNLPEAMNLLNKIPENILKEYTAETIDIDIDQST